jgi:ankyrin repeat protein
MNKITKATIFAITIAITVYALEIFAGEEKLEIPDQILFAAVGTGNLDMVVTAVEKGANVNARNANNATPLLLAAADKRYEITKYLVEKGADINAKGPMDATPLMISLCGKGSDNLAEYLISKGVDVKAAGNEGFTAVHLAAESGRARMVALLIEKGADKNAASEDGRTPLHMAAIHGRVEVVKALVEKKADVNLKTKHGDTPAGEAVTFNFFETLKLLVEAGAALDDSMIYDAISNGRRQSVRAEKNEDGTYRLIPTKMENPDNCAQILEYLLEKGLNANQNNADKDTPLNKAAWNGNIDAVKILVLKGAVLDARKKPGDYTPLGNAIYHDYTDIALFLIDCGADITIAPNEYNVSYLHMAAAGLSLEVVKKLVEKGADVNKKDKFNKTPFDEVVYRYHRSRNAELSSRPEMMSDLLLDNAQKNTADEIMIYLIEKGTQIDFKGERGTELLYTFADHQRPRMLKCLLSKGANPNLKSPKASGNPLEEAIDTGDIEPVKALIEGGADINANTFDGKPIIFRTLKKEIFILLVKSGAKINVKNTLGQTPLHQAVAAEWKEALVLLLECGADESVADNYGNTPLHEAITNQNAEIVEILISKKAALDARDKYGNTPLHLAVNCWNVELVRILLEHGANANIADNNGWTPLHSAAAIAYKAEKVKPRVDEIVKLLIEKGANTNAVDHENMTPLHCAAVANNPKAAEMLLANGAEISPKNKFGWTPLDYAAYSNKDNCAAFLKSKGATTDVLNKPEIMLINAIKQGNLQKVKELVEKGKVSVNTKIEALGGKNPLMTSINEKKNEIFNYLIEKGADVNIKTEKLDTPLLTAALCNCAEMAKVLIEKGADVNAAETLSNSTILHDAVYKNNFEIVKLLLDNGADMNRIDHLGYTPVYYAAQRGFVEIVEILADRGAKISKKTASIIQEDKRFEKIWEKLKNQPK